MSRKGKSPKPPAGAGRFSYEGLDRVMHEKARLGILASLAAHDGGLLFNDLKPEHIVFVTNYLATPLPLCTANARLMDFGGATIAATVTNDLTAPISGKGVMGNKGGLFLILETLFWTLALTAASHEDRARTDITTWKQRVQKREVPELATPEYAWLYRLKGYERGHRAEVQRATGLLFPGSLKGVPSQGRSKRTWDMAKDSIGLVYTHVIEAILEQ